LATTTSEPAAGNRPAIAVAAGILASRLVGLVRQRVIAHYFGVNTAAADAWAAGFRIPNVLQNLFGEGALSASFIPVYSALLARGQPREADRVAGATASLLALGVSVLGAAGLFASPALVSLIAPGFEGERRDLTVGVVRILFPGAGLLVLSAWCLGVLNSHGRFVLSYAAPVVWSAAMILALLWYGPGAPLSRLVKILAWSSVVGSALVFVIQIAAVVRVAPRLDFTPDASLPDVRSIIRNFVPAVFSRGVVQISAYIDTLIASLLPTGAVAGLTNAQVIYMLPVSLFGMAITAAELPAMARVAGADAIDAGALARRVDDGVRRMAFFVVPSAAAFLALGDVVAAALLQTGRFGRADSMYLWAILAGSAVGLVASTLGRLYASTFYALRDTRTPLRYAVVRVGVATALGYVAAIQTPRLLGVNALWGAAGLTAGSGIGGWVEMLLLRRALGRRIGPAAPAARLLGRLWVAAAVGAAAAWATKLALPPLHPIPAAVVVLGVYGAVYLAGAAALGATDARSLTARLTAMTQARRRGQDSSK
jgi:putative peptidoglycan lipid II flippase